MLLGWKHRRTKPHRKSEILPPSTCFSLFVCVLTILYFLLQFFVFVPNHKNTNGFVVFFSLIFPTLHPQNPFFANVRWFSPQKPLIHTHTHTHVCTNQNRIATITIRSDPPLNNRSTNSPCNTSTSIHHPMASATTTRHASLLPLQLSALFCNWWLCRLKSLGFLSERWHFNYIYKSRVSSGLTRVLRVPGQPSGSTGFFRAKSLADFSLNPARFQPRIIRVPSRAGF